MSSDRDQRLLRAQMAVRQGSLETAIGEYAALVGEHPDDLASANALGDLLVRAGRTPEALPLYVRVGDGYLREGFFSKAAGFYRKVLKFAPEEEATTLRLVEALARQRLAVEARTLLRGVEQARRRRGDVAGADLLVVALAELDPTDLDAKLEAARVLQRDADPRAPQWIADTAAALREAGRHREAVALLDERHATPEPVATGGAHAGTEVDLTDALNALALEHTGPEGPPAGDPSGPLPEQPATLEDVFDRLREEASPRRGTEGRQLLALGRTYLAAGMVEVAIDTLRRAALDAEARASAAVALSEMYEELEDPAQALEWLEHGADATDSPEPERIEAMRRLAEALERAREPERALAVWLEVATLCPQDAQAASGLARLSDDPRRT